MEDRAEQMKWCKDRALAELAREGDMRFSTAFAGFVSDCGKFEPKLVDWSSVPSMKLAIAGINAVTTRDEAALRKWIEGFA